MAKQYLTSRRRKGRFEFTYESSLDLQLAIIRQDPFWKSSAINWEIYNILDKYNKYPLTRGDNENKVY